MSEGERETVSMQLGKDRERGSQSPGRLPTEQGARHGVEPTTDGAAQAPG